MATARQQLAMAKRSQRNFDYYVDVLPLLKQWAEQGIPQEEQAGLLNGLGKVNYDGKPYTQVMVCRVLKRGIELGQIDPPNV